MPGYEGRLELTWTNKHLRLLAHEDGSYEWVPPSDYRVAEVRLLHDAGTVGEVARERDRASDNLLIRGDALNALTSLIGHMLAHDIDVHLAAHLLHLVNKSACRPPLDATEVEKIVASIAGRELRKRRGTR